MLLTLDLFFFCAFAGDTTGLIKLIPSIFYPFRSIPLLKIMPCSSIADLSDRSCAFAGEYHGTNQFDNVNLLSISINIFTVNNAVLQYR